MQIRRMAFIQYDSKTRLTQQLFLLKAGNVLELEYRVVNENGDLIPEPIRFEYRLSEELTKRLNGHKGNSPESYDAWRKTVDAIAVQGVLNSESEWQKARAMVVGIAVIATFGEPVWEFREDVDIVSERMQRLVRVRHQKAR